MHTTSPPYPRTTASGLLGGTGSLSALGPLLPPVPPTRSDEQGHVEAVRVDNARLSFGRAARHLGWSVDDDLVAERHPRHLVVRRRRDDVVAPVPAETVRIHEAQTRLALVPAFLRAIGLHHGDMALIVIPPSGDRAEIHTAWIAVEVARLIADGEIDRSTTSRLADDNRRLRTQLARVTGEHVTERNP